MEGALSLTYTTYDASNAYEATRVLWTWLDSKAFKEPAAFRPWLFDVLRVDSCDDTIAWKNYYWAKSVNGSGKTGTSWGAFSIESSERALAAEDFSTFLTRSEGPFGRKRGSGVVCTTLAIDGHRDSVVFKELWKMARRGVFSDSAPIYGVFVHADLRARDIPCAHAHFVHAPRFGIFNMQRLFTGERALANDVLGTFKRGSFKDREKFMEGSASLSQDDGQMMAYLAQKTQDELIGQVSLCA